MAYLHEGRLAHVACAQSEEQLEVLRWLSWNDWHWSRAVGEYYVQHIAKATFGLGPPDREALSAEGRAVLRFGKVLDDLPLRAATTPRAERLTIARGFQLASLDERTTGRAERSNTSRSSRSHAVGRRAQCAFRPGPNLRRQRPR